MRNIKHTGHSAVGRFFVKLLVFLLIFLVLASGLGMLLPVGPGGRHVRQVFHEFREAGDDVDILFVGASRFYRGVDTPALDKQLGTESYMLSSAGQRLMDSYYVLKEVYETATPEVVVLDVGIKRTCEDMDDFGMESFYRIYGNLRPSLNKAAYFFSRVPFDNYLIGLFRCFANPYDLLESPLDAVKTRLSTSYREYDPAPIRTSNSHYGGRGYFPVDKTRLDKEGGKVRFKDWQAEKAAFNEYYINQCIELCRQNGSKVVLINMPLTVGSVRGTADYDDYLAFGQRMAQADDVFFCDFSMLKHEIFAPVHSYFYDSYHMSGKGAEACAPVLAETIAGSLDESKWFYQDSASLMDASPYVFNTWLVDNKDGTVTANAYAPPGSAVEYRFFYAPVAANGEAQPEYALAREYAAEPTVALADMLNGQAPNKYTIRVEARLVGSGEDFEQAGKLKVTWN